MSQILTNYLDIKDLPPVDPDDDNVEETSPRMERIDGYCKG